MGGYFNRGASAGGHDEGYFNRPDITGPAGVGSATGGPGGVARTDIVQDEDNPNIVRAVPQESRSNLDETAGTTTRARTDAAEDGDDGINTYPDIVEGSDSARTGTSWGLPPVEDGETVTTPQGQMPEGEGKGEAHPNRNTGDRLSRDELQDIGSWSTIQGRQDSAGSPTGDS